MTGHRVSRGRKTQALVAAYLAAHGWPRAETRPASLSGTDVMHADGLAVEVKARADFAPLLWMRQAQRNAAPAQVPLVVMRPNGSGEGDVADWPAFLRLSDLVALLHAAGYGQKDPTP